MDPTFGPFEKWLSVVNTRHATVVCRAGNWNVRLWEGLTEEGARSFIACGHGASLAEACANAMNDIMVAREAIRRGDIG